MSVPRLDVGARQSGTARGEWLQPLAGHWIEAARQRLLGCRALVRVTITAVRGSAPREPGASLLVDATSIVGTIGGGHLEWQVTALARELLAAPGSPSARLVKRVLGPELGQCCGGQVEIWLERLTRRDLDWLSEAAHRLRDTADRAPHACLASEIVAGGQVYHRLEAGTASAMPVEVRRGAAGGATLLEQLRGQRPHLWIFGAGHVGQALVRVLEGLRLFEISWIDTRGELLPLDLPDAVTALCCATPQTLVASAPAGARFVIMTHDHALDYELCRAILARTDAGWLGLIGSASKSARFRSRLKRDGLEAADVSRLHCPIGIPGVSSKLPGAIAIAIAAQLLQEAAAAPATGGASDTPCRGACNSCA